MRRSLLVLMGVTLFIFVGCTARTVDGKSIAEDFVKSQGYEITDQKGEIENYILEKSKLYGGTETISYQQMWGVQTIEPDKYFGKEIVIYGFTVENHPLQKREEHTENGVNLYIMLSDGNVIGGYSYPNADVYGAYSSLDGKTIEEVTGLSFQEWQDNWEEKYGNQIYVYIQRWKHVVDFLKMDSWYGSHAYKSIYRSGNIIALKGIGEAGI